MSIYQQKLLAKLHQEVRVCRRCRLWKTREKAVPGEGDFQAKIFFVGEAPGVKENEEGRPFLGLAGKFLEELFRKIKLKRKKVYLTSLVKCWPPHNRLPKKDELESCRPYLKRQIGIIKPKVVVLLGKLAQDELLIKKRSLAHGRIAEKDNLKYFVTFHPAAARRFPKIKKKMMADFQKIKPTLR